MVPKLTPILKGKTFSRLICDFDLFYTLFSLNFAHISCTFICLNMWRGIQIVKKGLGSRTLNSPCSWMFDYVILSKLVKIHELFLKNLWFNYQTLPHSWHPRGSTTLAPGRSKEATSSIRWFDPTSPEFPSCCFLSLNTSISYRVSSLGFVC